MPAITIRDVPDETRDALAARAAATGRSLQEYLRRSLIELRDGLTTTSSSLALRSGSDSRARR